jgi:gamma-D-glutamyl-L-lysine dipeptidyl-peptidase
MDYALNLMSIIPVRANADDRSEQVTQLLFGEMVMVLEVKDKWVHVQVLADSYQGWVSYGQLTTVSKGQVDHLLQQSQHVSTDLVQVLQNKSLDCSFLVSAGSSFYGCREGSFELLGNQYTYYGNLLDVTMANRETLIQNALLFLHTPYMWGGKSALGIDCSGFTQLVFKMSGINIHRDASQQATQGEMVNLINEAVPGDLLFFDNDEGNIIHTGILIDDVHIIHAHQKVRIDKVDHLGIFNVDTKKYTHKLRLIKRI